MGRQLTPFEYDEKMARDEENEREQRAAAAAEARAEEQRRAEEKEREKEAEAKAAEQANDSESESVAAENVQENANAQAPNTGESPEHGARQYRVGEHVTVHSPPFPVMAEYLKGVLIALAIGIAAGGVLIYLMRSNGLNVDLSTLLQPPEGTPEDNSE